VRVAVVTTSWPRFAGDPGGHFVEADVRAMARRGEDVEVIAAEGDAFGWPGVAARVRARPWRAIGAVAWVARARSRVSSGGFDRVVAHWAVPSACPIATSEPSRGAFALEVVSHGSDVRLIAAMPAALRAHVVRLIAERAESWRFVAAHLVETVSSAVPGEVRRALERVARVEPSAIEVSAPNASEVNAKRARIGEPFAVCVGRLVATKRVDTAIAWAGQRRTTLVVVGDGPERPRLERVARGSASRVVFVGDVGRAEALAWIAASGLVVSASTAEGLSTVKREAEALAARFVELTR
jgi:glycosyltransferase involved in cell wall biosynthesis